MKYKYSFEKKCSVIIIRIKSISQTCGHMLVWWTVLPTLETSPCKDIGFIEVFVYIFVFSVRTKLEPNSCSLYFFSVNQILSIYSYIYVFIYSFIYCCLRPSTYCFHPASTKWTHLCCFCCSNSFQTVKGPLMKPLCYPNHHSSHKKQPSSMTLNWSPHTDLNGCVKLLIEHLRARGLTHWSSTLFSLGPDREYWYTRYGSTIWDFTWMWSFLSLSMDWRHVSRWIYCFAWPFQHCDV